MRLYRDPKTQTAIKQQIKYILLNFEEEESQRPFSKFCFFITLKKKKYSQPRQDVTMDGLQNLLVNWDVHVLKITFHKPKKKWGSSGTTTWVQLSLLHMRINLFASGHISLELCIEQYLSG